MMLNCGMGFPMLCSASAAQSARIKWKKGNQRKLQRKTPALGSIESKSTRKSRSNSQRTFLRNGRPRFMTPAISAIGDTKPHAISVAGCGMYRVEKSAQLTVQHGRINAGSAGSGTIHCQCAALDVTPRADP